MPSVNATYGAGKFLDVPGVKAATCNGQLMELTIKAVMVVDFKGKQKLQLAFRESDRCLTLNKTSAKAIGAAYGDASEDWTGRAVRIRTGLVAFGTGQVEAVLCDPVQNTGPSRASGQAAGMQRVMDPSPKQHAEDAIVEVRKELLNGRDFWRVKTGRSGEFYTKDAGVGREANDLCGMGEVVRLTYTVKPNPKTGQMFKILTAIQTPAAVPTGADNLELPDDDIPF